MLECMTTTRIPVRGRKHLDRKRKETIALEAKVHLCTLKSSVVENGAKIGASPSHGEGSLTNHNQNA